MRNGRLLRGSSVTWLATFSRHILPIAPNDGLKFAVVEGVDPATGARYDDVITTGFISVDQLRPAQESGTTVLLRGLGRNWQKKVRKGFS